MKLKVFRVIVATEDVVSPEHPNPFPGVQHVVYVVAPDKRAVYDVIAADDMLRHLKDVPKIQKYSDTRWDIPTDLPLWTVKIGPRHQDQCILSLVAATGGDEEIRAALLVLHASQPAIIDLIDADCYRICPRPIDVETPGVW